MMIPDSAGYQPETCEVEIDDLLYQVANQGRGQTGGMARSSPQGWLKSTISMSS